MRTVNDFRMPSDRNLARFCLLGVLCATPATIAQANTGTPLMWMQMFHLVVANLFIGLFEALLLWKLARTAYLRAMVAMIAANYVSAYVGLKVLVPRAREAAAGTPGFPMDHAGDLLQSLMLTAFVATLAVEAPFWIAAAWKRVSIGRSLAAFVLAQIVSYGCLIYLYDDVMPTEALALPRDHSMGFVPRNHPATVYYIGADDGDLWKVNLDGSGRERIGPIDLFDSEAPPGQPALDAEMRLYVEAIDVVERDGGGHRLVATRHMRGGGSQVLIEDLANALGPGSGHAVDFGARETRPEADRDPVVKGGFWAGEGMVILPRESPAWSVRYETPIDAWAIRRLSVLPGNLAVFDFGPRQICVLDLETRQIGVLAAGRSNVVAMPGVRYVDEPHDRSRPGSTSPSHTNPAGSSAE